MMIVRTGLSPWAKLLRVNIWVVEISFRWEPCGLTPNETSRCFPHTHIVLIKVSQCIKARLCSMLSGRGFRGVPLFVFQADLLALGRTIILTSLPWKVCLLSDCTQVTSGTTQNSVCVCVWGGAALWTSKQAVKFALRCSSIYTHYIQYRLIAWEVRCLTCQYLWILSFSAKFWAHTFI